MKTDNLNSPSREPAKATGRKYNSVDELMRGEGVSQEVQGKVKELETETLKERLLYLEHENVVLQQRAEKAEAACAEMREVLGTDKSWPLIGVLNRLSLAAMHLLHGHNCDCQGHEEISQCVRLADEYSKAIHALSTDCGKGWRSPDDYAALEKKCAVLEATPFEQERKRLVEFLQHNFPNLSGVDAWPVERAIYQLRRMARELQRLEPVDNLNNPSREPAKATGRKYNSVDELMRGEGVSQEVRLPSQEEENQAVIAAATLALDNRLPSDTVHPIVAACEEYRLAEDELPDEFDTEDYCLSKAIRSLVSRIRELENQVKAWEAACAESQNVIRALTECIDDSRCALSDYDIQHALSTDCGKDYFNIAELEPTIACLRRIVNRCQSTGVTFEQQSTENTEDAAKELRRLEALKGETK